MLKQGQAAKLVPVQGARVDRDFGKVIGAGEGETMTNELKVGKLIKQSEERDAIHIAIAPVQAAVEIKPGTHVGFVGNRNDTVSPHAIRLVGIIDPFLTKPVKEGERCWLFVYPNQITSLNHHWKHPAFDKDAPRETVPFIPSGLECKGE